MESTNIYQVYHEKVTYQEKGGKVEFRNGETVQCDTISELIYTLKECESMKHKNVIINTIVNGKQQ